MAILKKNSVSFKASVDCMNNEDGELFLATGTQTPSTNPLFLGSCVLVNKEINHRVLINKNNLGTFNLFSCYLSNQTHCSYEVNK